eukprot:10075990-Alexandrium_andersonii.AAC.1
MPDVDFVQGAAGEGLPDAFSDASVSPPERPWEAMAGLGAWVGSSAVRRGGWGDDPEGIVQPAAVDF